MLHKIFIAISKFKILINYFNTVNRGYFATPGLFNKYHKLIKINIIIILILLWVMLYCREHVYVYLQFLYNISTPEKNILPKCYFLRVFF